MGSGEARKEKEENNLGRRRQSEKWGASLDDFILAREMTHHNKALERTSIFFTPFQNTGAMRD